LTVSDDRSIHSLPLLNRTVFAACSAKKMEELAAGLSGMGAFVLRVPIIETVEIEDKVPLDRALKSLAEYDWLVFTSAYGVSFFMRRKKELGITGELPRICAIGPATAEAVREYGCKVALIADKYVAEGVVEALENVEGPGSLRGRKVLIARAQEGRDVLPQALAAGGATVDLVPCYRTVPGRLDERTMEALRTKRPDLVVFTSSSTVRNFLELYNEEERLEILGRAAVAVIGPVTGATVESFGKLPEIVPKQNTIASLLSAIREYYGRGGTGAD